MAKIYLENTENNVMRISVDGTGSELIDLFSNAFQSREYLLVAAAKSLANCIAYEYIRGKNEETK